MTVKNSELAWKVFDRIEVEVGFGEETDLGWDQGFWFAEVLPTVSEPEPACGTFMCFAGWTCHLSGGTLNWQVGRENLPEIETCYLGDKIQGARRGFAMVNPASGRVRQVRPWAQELLGLSGREASELFFETDTDLGVLEAKLVEIFGPRPGEGD